MFVGFSRRVGFIFRWVVTRDHSISAKVDNILLYILYTAELTLTHVEVEAVLKSSSSEIPAAVVHCTVQCSDSRSTAAFVWFLSKLSLLSALLERVQSIAHRAANHMQYESGKVLIFLYFLAVFFGAQWVSFEIVCCLGAQALLLITGQRWCVMICSRGF